MTTTVLNSKDYTFEGVIINSLIEEYVRKGNLTYPTIAQVFGPMPKIPDSPDNDARLEAWEEQVEYSNKVNRVEEYIKSIIKNAIKD